MVMRSLRLQKTKKQMQSFLAMGFYQRMQTSPVPLGTQALRGSGQVQSP